LIFSANRDFFISKCLKKWVFHYFRRHQKHCMSKQNLMKTARLFLILTVALFISSVAVAQTKATKKADDEFATGGYTEAAKLYKTAEAGIKDLTEKGRVFYQIGECYRLTTQYSASDEWYAKAITAQYYNTDPEVYFAYALSLQEQGKFEEAIAQLNKYTAKGGEKSKANDRIKACQMASEKKASLRSKITVENLAELNSPSFDYCLVYSSKKGDEFIFSSSRKEATGSGLYDKTGDDFMDLFVAERDKKKKWGTPTPLNNTVNTPSHEGVSSFNKDFDEMYYTYCKYDNDERFACDILMAKRSGSGFADPVNLNLIDRTADDSSKVGHPFITNDGKYLLFASDMPGGKGGKDIWYVTYDKKNESWSKPTNLSAVNSNGDDVFPYVAADGTLYFASNGRGGFGGLDIFKADKTGEMTFGTPAGLDYPINSSSDDFGFILEVGNAASKFSGFFTSNRPGGKGLDDIYYFTEPPIEFELIATVYDEQTAQAVANADVTVTGSNGDSYKITTDGNGGFSLDKTKIQANTSYKVEVNKKDYIGTGDSFSTVGVSSSTKFAKEYFIAPIIVGEKEYPMPLVLYPYNEDKLLIDETVNSADSLNYLYNLLVQNPTFIIQLEAHTDARGKDDYNQDLSQRRAQTCVNYLIGKGIAADRIKAVGKGEKEPRTLPKDAGVFKAGTQLTEAYISKLPADQQEAAHLLNRRTVFRIIGTNYTPK
jgi:peptidoglycan-associated lipoprotein